MSELNYWGTFLTAAVALNIAPAPDLVFILSRTLANGWRVGLASSSLGVCTGALVHVCAATVGVSALLMTSDVAFTMLKVVGTVYLVYLGVRTLFAASDGLREHATRSTACRPWTAFLQGVLIDVLNPKVALFSMAFLPQFVRPESGSPVLQIVSLGFLVIVVAMLVELIIVIAAARIARGVREDSRILPWLQRVFGGVMIALGIRVATATR